MKREWRNLIRFSRSSVGRPRRLGRIPTACKSQCSNRKTKKKTFHEKWSKAKDLFDCILYNENEEDLPQAKRGILFLVQSNDLFEVTPIAKRSLFGSLQTNEERVMQSRCKRQNSTEIHISPDDTLVCLWRTHKVNAKQELFNCSAFILPLSVRSIEQRPLLLLLLRWNLISFRMNKNMLLFVSPVHGIGDAVSNVSMKLFVTLKIIFSFSRLMLLWQWSNDELNSDVCKQSILIATDLFDFFFLSLHHSSFIFSSLKPNDKRTNINVENCCRHLPQIQLKFYPFVVAFWSFVSFIFFFISAFAAIITFALTLFIYFISVSLVLCFFPFYFWFSVKSSWKHSL